MADGKRKTVASTRQHRASDPDDFREHLDRLLRDRERIWEAAAAAGAAVARIERTGRIVRSTKSMDQLLKQGNLLLRQDNHIVGANRAIDGDLQDALSQETGHRVAESVHAIGQPVHKFEITQHEARGGVRHGDDSLT